MYRVPDPELTPPVTEFLPPIIFHSFPSLSTLRLPIDVQIGILLLQEPKVTVLFCAL
jgi:hypothetical protein